MIHTNNQEGSGWEEAGEAAMIPTKQIVLKQIDEHQSTDYKGVENCTKQAVKAILGLFLPCMFLGALNGLG